MANWRRWAVILFGVGILLAVLAVGAVIFGAAWVGEHVDIQDATSSTAESRLDEIRDRFADRPPLIEVRDGDVRRNDPPAGATPADLSTVHLLAWDADEEKIVRVDLPFWLVRLRGLPLDTDGARIEFGDREVPIDAEDIERYGTGIIVDAELTSGERAVIWVE